MLRKRSPFAQQLEEARQDMQVQGRRLSKVPEASRANSYARSQQDLRIHGGSRPGSRINSQANSRAASRANSRRNSVSGV